MALGRFLVRLGRFIESLALAVMRPDDIIEFDKLKYGDAASVAQWSEEQLLAGGLSATEKSRLEQVPVKRGRVLVLGVGGGREAIALAQLGHEVVGVDFVQEMVDRAEANAAQQGVKIRGLVGDFSRLDLPPGSFDLVLLQSAMYSGVPTRNRRVQMLQRLGRFLKPGGFFLCDFYFNPVVNRGAARLRQAAAYLTLGNFGCQEGDTLWGNEFLHAFQSQAELESEFTAGGFEVVQSADLQTQGFYGALLRKRLAS